MQVGSTKEVELIVRSVILDYGLANVRLEDIREIRVGWLITVVRSAAGASSFSIFRGTPAAVRVAIARGFGLNV